MAGRRLVVRVGQAGAGSRAVRRDEEALAAPRQAPGQDREGCVFNMVVVGVEALLILCAIRGLNRAEMMAVCRWSARTLGRAAMAEAGHA